MADDDSTGFLVICIILLIINAISYFLGLFPKDDLFKPTTIVSLIVQFFIFLFIFVLGLTWIVYSQPGGYYQQGENRVYTPGTTVGPLFQLGMIVIGLGGIYWNFYMFLGVGLFGVFLLIVGRCLYGLIDKKSGTQFILNSIGIISVIIGIFSIIIAIGQFFGVLKI